MQLPADAQNIVHDSLQLEADARRLRAAFIAQGFRALRSAINARFAQRSLAKPQA